MHKYTGLSTAQAEKILKEDGLNKLSEAKKSGLISVFAGQFKDVMVLILLAATAFSLLMGEIWDAVTIIIIVILNACLGFFQEYRTEKTLEALKKIAAPTARVYRDRRLVTLPADRLVRGDIIRLEAGSRVPADCKLLEASALECDESMLTGESFGVAKRVGDGCFMGTNVTKGHGVAQIIAIGTATEMGRISEMLTEIEPEKTPLQKRLSELGKIMGIACLAVCFLVALIGVLRGFGLFDMTLTGISLAVAAIPEGLPATVTISLALAVRRIYKQKALVNKLHSVETLGCTNIICTDKTGTLTQNKMSVVDTWGENKNLLYLCGALCNNAQKQPDGSFVGDPTETALMTAAVGNALMRSGKNNDVIGTDKSVPYDEYTRISEIPFDNAARFMAVTVENKNGEQSDWLKGAPDAVLKQCNMTDKQKREVLAQVESMAAKALRILGFAYRTVGSDASGAPKESYTFLGLQGLQDPLRPEVKSAVRKCRAAGIRVIMLTGDHKNTAEEIARQAGIAEVHARMTPADKLKLVKKLKADGNIVAMTGDGVNDAPAVKEANIGAAMGITGTDVTKEAAQIVLLDDNFATLVSAVEQGRTIYNNIRKFVRYMLSCNIGEIITMLFALLLGMPVALLPIQILLINLVTDGLPAVALGMEPPDEDIMKKPPRKSDESIFAGNLLIKILLRGLGIGFFTLLTFHLVLQSGSLAAARTAALATLGLSQLIFVFECKDSERGLFNARFGNNKKLIGAVFISFAIILCVMTSGLLSPVFKTVPLALSQVLAVFGLSLGYPVLKGVLKSRRLF
ncbi:MAG: cation-translocating P-type ATPase [Oscillospiraceae bacterium]|nr:cation-translocating P-type ATPase [Oscillospiraceae bacterium]